MATYAIGDIQGCYQQLQNLLDKIHFYPTQDQLWLTGDLVNRGPRSLEVLRFLKQLTPPPIIVLGNHDLSLLANAAGVRALQPQDTILPILEASDGPALCDWLRHQPLLHHDQTLGFTMVHAGLPPQWDLSQARFCATEVEHVLRGENYLEFLHHMYGHEPDQWREDLSGWERLRFITNCLTRIRFCDEVGRLDLKSKGRVGSQPVGFMPWFQVPHRASRGMKIIIGHWAALEGRVNEPGIYALDTGCVWGRQLTALRLEDGQLFSVGCS